MEVEDVPKSFVNKHLELVFSDADLIQNNLQAKHKK